MTAKSLQRAYYERTASAYDGLHTSRQDDEHYVALDFIDSLCDRLRLETLLDVGAGTGRGVRFLRERHRNVRGVEPVPALTDQSDLPKGSIICGDGYALPFGHASFDAVFECGALHHVADPRGFVAEMTRVARRAVFLSDCNRFGQGCRATRALKFALYKARLWPAIRFVQTRGKMYSVTAGDGIAYSYSVYDSYDQLAQWADEIWVLPTHSASPAASWLNPLLTASHVLLCAFKT